MVDTNFLNQTIQTTELDGIAYYISAIPKYLTEQITNFLRSYNFQVTEGWTRMLLYTISLGLVFLAMKISKPIIKYLLIMLCVLLILGIWIPYW